MRILILGAGATGGYFGGRMLEAGCDVTFLVRPARAAFLSTNGLIVESPLGDIRLPAPTVTADAAASEWDVVLLSCKAFDLDEAIGTVGGVIGPQTKVLPVLNGLAHLDRLDSAFGSERVLGGLCAIAATLTRDGMVKHLNRAHTFTFGHRTDDQRRFCEVLFADLGRARVDVKRSDAIVLEMWEKWVLLATLAASTCLMRAPVGDIVAAPGGEAVVTGLLDEIQSIAEANGNAARPHVITRVRALLTEAGSGFAASMLRDVEAGGRIEADHIIGDLLRRGAEKGVEAPHLRIAYAHLKAYEARREHEPGR
ncbi:MAG: 2-dehydropantoate 2-reductase [Rhodospirillales bacterium]|nr:2-dehydropantoate 2-reductase [Rhodospirillales bacterium]